MSRPKTLKDPVRFAAVVERDTYKALISMAGKRADEEGRIVSLAEYVRTILDDATKYAKKP